MQLSLNQKVFLTLLKAGLWEQEALLASFGNIDYSQVLKLAEEQSVVGLVTEGLENVRDVKVPQEVLLQFIGATLQIEQRNKEMNIFVANLINNLRLKDIYTLLLKGQGVAQCYEKPLWRASGDVDLFLSDNNYATAKSILLNHSSSVENEMDYNKHIAMTIDNWSVELHGALRGGLWRSIDCELDRVQDNVFYGGKVRS